MGAAAAPEAPGATPVAISTVTSPGQSPAGQPAVPADAARTREIQNLVTAVNQTLAFNPADNTLKAGTRELDRLGGALSSNPTLTAEISEASLKKDLPKDATEAKAALQKRREAVTEYLKTKEGGTQIHLPAVPGSSATVAGGTEAGTAPEKKVIDTVTVNSVSTIGLVSGKKADIESLHTQSATTTAPAVTVFRNKNNPETAYITISRVGPDGKLKATEIAAIASADLLGSAGTRPSHLTATIWTPGASGATQKAGNMDLAGLKEEDIAKIQEVLRGALKPQSAPKPAPGQGAQPREGTPSSGGADGSGAATPSKGEKPGATSPKPSSVVVDGKLDKVEGLVLLNTPNLVEALKAEYPKVEVTPAEHGEGTISFPEAIVQITQSGKMTVVWNSGFDDEARRRAWIKKLESFLKKQAEANGAASPS